MPMCRESLIDFSKYTITEDGRIFSKHFNRYMSGYIDSEGYVQTSFICTGTKANTFNFHRVIWYYFNGDIPEGMQVNHIDEDKTNNALSNLNLMTPKQNSNWGTKNERQGETFKNNGKRSKPVEQYNLETNETIAVFPSANEVKRRLGFDVSSICVCCKGGSYRKGKWVNKRQAHGYGWRYANI